MLAPSANWDSLITLVADIAPATKAIANAARASRCELFGNKGGSLGKWVVQRYASLPSGRSVPGRHKKTSAKAGLSDCVRQITWG